MKTVKSKEKLFVMLMCIVLILPLAPIGAQESNESWSDDTWSDKNYLDDTNTASPETSTPQTAAEPTAPKASAGTTTPKAATGTTAPKTGGQTPSLKVPNIDGAKMVNTAFGKVVGIVSQIGAMFGKSAGGRIGGTSVSAIVMLVVAKLVQDRGPSWLKWLLYLSGGTMVAGSGANITQMIMGLLS